MISKCRRHPDNLNNTTRLPTIFSKHVDVKYKPVIVQTKETNVICHKEVVDVIEKQNYAVEVQIYDVPICNARVVKV